MQKKRKINSSVTVLTFYKLSSFLKYITLCFRRFVDFSQTEV